MTDLEQMKEMGRIYYDDYGNNKIIDIYCHKPVRNAQTITTNYLGTQKSITCTFEVTKDKAQSIVSEACRMYFDLTPNMNELVYREIAPTHGEYCFAETNNRGDNISQLCIHNISLGSVMSVGRNMVLSKANGIYADIKTYKKVYQKNSENWNTLNQVDALNYHYSNRLLELYHTLSRKDLIRYASNLTSTQLEKLGLNENELNEIKLQAAIHYCTSSEERLALSILEQMNPIEVYPGMSKNIQKSLGRKVI